MGHLLKARPRCDAGYGKGGHSSAGLLVLMPDILPVTSRDSQSVCGIIPVYYRSNFFAWHMNTDIVEGPRVFFPRVFFLFVFFFFSLESPTLFFYPTTDRLAETKRKIHNAAGLERYLPPLDGSARIVWCSC